MLKSSTPVVSAQARDRASAHDRLDAIEDRHEQLAKGVVDEIQSQIASKERADRPASFYVNKYEQLLCKSKCGSPFKAQGEFELQCTFCSCPVKCIKSTIDAHLETGKHVERVKAREKWTDMMKVNKPFSNLIFVFMCTQQLESL